MCYPVVAGVDRVAPDYMQGGERLPLSNPERVKLMASRRGVTLAQIAGMLGMSRQGLNSRMKLDTLSADDMRKVAEFLGCTYKSVFVMNDTGEEV